MSIFSQLVDSRVRCSVRGHGYRTQALSARSVSDADEQKAFFERGVACMEPKSHLEAVSVSSRHILILLSIAVRLPCGHKLRAR